jgi:hypothetical protein
MTDLLICNPESLKILAVIDLHRKVQKTVLLSNRFLPNSSSILKSLHETTGTVYLAHNNPYFLVFFGILTLLTFPTKLIVFFPELYDNYKLLKIPLRFIVRKSDSVIVPSYNRKIALQMIYHKAPSVIIKTNNLRDYEKKKPIVIDRDQTAKRSGSYIYTGVLYPSRNVVEGLPKNKTCTIYGSGDDKYIGKLKLMPFVDFRGGFDKEDEEDLVRMYETGIIYYPMNSINNTTCSPNKFYTYKRHEMKLFCLSPNAFGSQITYYNHKRDAENN